MLCIRPENKDPYFCLAAEDYLMKYFSEDIFMLWQSYDAVVVGKHQNAMAEINYPFVHENNIKVARRISGGGTVFHDKGNVNFAYIKNVASPSEISFSRFVQPIIEVLAKLGIQAVTSGRNDLLLEGRKISGNAEHIFKNRVLHHGTLLFDSNLNTLGQAIKVVPGKYHGKAVESNRSTVTNILPHLKTPMTLNDFTSNLLGYELTKQGNNLYQLNDEDTASIRKLVDDKFSSWNWNFGYSPKYTFRNKKLIKGKILEVELKVEKGHITEAIISGEYFSESQATKLITTLNGQKHFYDDIRGKLLEFDSEISETAVYTFF